MSSPHEIITHLSRTRGIVDKFRIYELIADENVTLTHHCLGVMASVNQKRFEDENLVIISSNTEIDMTQWRKYLVENWDKVFFSISILSL